MNNPNNAAQYKEVETASGSDSFLYTIEADGAVSSPRRCCPYCHMEFSWDEYEEHDCRGHYIVNAQARQRSFFQTNRENVYAAINRKAAQMANNKKKVRKRKGRKKKRENNRHQRQGVTKYEFDRYEQDGSKNIGYVCRENGRYGSFPMHDDYSDEAQP